MHGEDSRYEPHHLTEFVALARRMAGRQRSVLKSYMLLKMQRVKRDPLFYRWARQEDWQPQPMFPEPVIIGGHE